VGHRTGLDDVEKRKFLILRDSNSEPSVVLPVSSHYTDCDIPAHTIQWVPELKRQRREADQSLPSRAEVKNIHASMSSLLSA
jgi:hypothetical protein